MIELHDLGFGQKQFGKRHGDRVDLEAAVHRQLVAHLEVTDKDIHVPFTVGVQVDLALRAIQEVELTVRFVAQFLEERLDALALVFCHHKVQVMIFTREEFLQNPRTARGSPTHRWRASGGNSHARHRSTGAFQPGCQVELAYTSEMGTS